MARGHDGGVGVAASVDGRTISAGRRTVFLAFLMVIYAFNFIDRQIVVILQEPIKHEYRLADWQVGLLTGGAISLFYTAASLPIARWIDRGLNRVRLIAVMTAVWSLMTSACGLTQTYAQFLVARMGVGLAEAGYAPAAHSLIADLYDKHRRPFAMGVLAMGIPFGIMFGLSLGGYIAQHYGWRMALMLVGMPGVVVAGLFWLIAREPVRGASEAGAGKTGVAPMPFGQAMKALWATPAYVRLVISATICSFVSTGLTSWLPSLLIRGYGLSLMEAGVGLGVLSGITGLLGAFIGGWQASKLSPRGLHATMWIPTIGMVVAIPLFIVSVTLGSSTTVLWLLALPLILNMLWSAPSVAIKQTIAPVPLRATASALSNVFTNILGVAGGPIVAGLLSDMFGKMTGNSADGLRWALITLSCGLLVGAFFWILTMRALKQRESDMQSASIDDHVDEVLATPAGGAT